MLTFFTIIHVLLCVFMVFVILQPGKDAGMGAALGGGAATSAFGGRGAVTFLSKVTAVCAGLFFLTSLGLSFVGLRTSLADRAAPPPVSAPATPPAGTDGAKPPEGAATTPPAPTQGLEQSTGTSTPVAPANPATPGPTGNTAPPPAPSK